MLTKYISMPNFKNMKLQIRKAVSVLCVNPPPRVAVICNVTSDRGWLANYHTPIYQIIFRCLEGGDQALFSVTDCLQILKLAMEEDGQIGAKTLNYFVDRVQRRRGLISVMTTTT